MVGNAFNLKRLDYIAIKKEVLKIKIAVIGGAQPELKEFVKQAKEKIDGSLEFHIFDTADNIAEPDFWKYYQCETPDEMALEAVKLAKSGEIDILVKGIVSSHVLLKAVLNKDYSLKQDSLLAHMTIVDAPKLKRKILLTDAGMNIAPGKNEIIEIIKHAVDTAHKIGIKQPKVAMLSAAENYNKRMESSVVATELTEFFAENENAIIYGPLSLDLALSKKSVKLKNFKGPIAGNADVLVVPNIDAGNMLYKSFGLLGEAKMGGIIVGASLPIVLTSRSDDVESKLLAFEFAISQVRNKVKS